MSTEDWVWLNRTGIFEDPELRKYVSPFPPPELIYSVSALENERDFASHGADLFLALSQVSPLPLTGYKNLLDFGCGCGRLARMFKGFSHAYYGCDMNMKHIDWLTPNLPFMKATHNHVHLPLPYADDCFDGIISISVFTHLSEINQDRYLSELRRVARSGAYLFLTVHGSRALERARTENKVRNLIAVKDPSFQAARALFEAGKYAFILQQSALTRLRWRTKKLLLKMAGKPPNPLQRLFEYGMTFIPESYVRSHWTRWFEVLDYRTGAIHDFQDIVVLRPKK